MEDQTELNKTILLVDDDQFITVAYKDGLERAGYKVITAHNGEEALARLELKVPDLMLLDIIMPKMNGFEVLQAVRKNSKTKKLPVIVLTNLSQQSDREEAEEYAIIDFMVKADVSLKDVVLRIDGILKITD